MLARAITSLQHPLVKHLVKLRTSREERALNKSVLVVGTKMVTELALPLKTLVVEEGVQIPKKLIAQECYTVPSALLKKISGTENPEPFAAVVALPEPADLFGKSYILVLDGISDPGNLGTLLRTALALGWEGAFITRSSCDPFNDKALRAARGATFRLPLFLGEYGDLDKLIAQKNVSVYVADAKGKSYETQKITPPLLLILGSESHGVKFSPPKGAVSLAIPISDKMESLNVAIAGSLLMHAIKGSP